MGWADLNKVDFIQVRLTLNRMQISSKFDKNISWISLFYNLNTALPNWPITFYNVDQVDLTQEHFS